MLLWSCCGSGETIGGHLLSLFSLIDAPLLGLFLRPGSFSQMGIGGVAWRVVSDGSEGLCWALTTAPDRLLL